MAGKKKITRKQLLKGTDEFLTLSNRAAIFFTDHINQFKVLGVALLIIAVAYLAVHFYLRSVNKGGQTAYNTAYYTLTQNLKADLSPETLEEAASLFQKVRDEYGLSKAARLALPQVAFAKFLEKKYDEAISLYRQFLDEVSGDLEYEFLARLALAACHEAKGELKEARETLNAVLEHPENPFKETAMLNMSRLYRLENMTDKSKEILRQFIEEYPASPFLPLAKALL